MNCSIHEDGTSVRVAPEGDLDMHVASEFRKILHQVLESRPNPLVVDLAKVPFVDSSGIATIIEALKLLRPHEGEVRVVGCRETVRDTFEIAGLTEILGVQ